MAQRFSRDLKEDEAGSIVDLLGNVHTSEDHAEATRNNPECCAR
jgi:hypothetical protein